MRFNARTDTVDKTEWQEDGCALGVGLNVNREQGEETLLRTYLKGIMRDGLEHVFIHVNDETVMTLVVQPDGSIERRHDIPY